MMIMLYEVEPTRHLDRVMSGYWILDVLSTCATIGICLLPSLNVMVQS